MTEIEGTPELTVDHAVSALQGLSPGSKYLASWIYERYVAQQAAQGRGAVHASVFGRMLGRLGCQRRRIGTDAKGRAAWLISKWAFDPMNVEAVREAIEGRRPQAR